MLLVLPRTMPVCFVGMLIETLLDFTGSYAAVEVALVPGDCVKAESGGMVSMSTNVHMEAKLEGTATEALTRCCCSGESMFLTYYSLKPGEVRYLTLCRDWIDQFVLVGCEFRTKFCFGREHVSHTL